MGSLLRLWLHLPYHIDMTKFASSRRDVYEMSKQLLDIARSIRRWASNGQHGARVRQHFRTNAGARGSAAHSAARCPVIGDLPASRTAANRRRMKKSIIQSILLIVALLACPDTPALAYENLPAGAIYGQQQGYVESSDVGVPDDNSATGSSGELSHHHHCPAGMVAGEAAVPATGLPVRGVHLSRAATELASRATAPPTQPPAA